MIEEISEIFLLLGKILLLFHYHGYDLIKSSLHKLFYAHMIQTGMIEFLHFRKSTKGLCSKNTVIFSNIDIFLKQIPEKYIVLKRKTTNIIK